ncbi:MAG: hypothetical protein ACP5T3_03450 [Candidatus Micrarchaeia archaeon]
MRTAATTTIKAPVSNSTKTTTNTISNTTSTTTISALASCISGLQEVAIPNGNFSTGTYADWNITGYGFSSEPLNLTNANKNGGYYGAPWSNYGNNTFAATTFQKGLAVQPGNLTSKPFLVTEPFLNFKIVSSQNNDIYVEILHNGKPAIVAHYNTYAAPGNPNPQTTFENASIPLSTLLCQNVSIRVVFVATGLSTTQYIAVTGFYLSKTPTYTPGIVVNQTLV